MISIITWYWAAFLWQSIAPMFNMSHLHRDTTVIDTLFMISGPCPRSSKNLFLLYKPLKTQEPPSWCSHAMHAFNLRSQLFPTLDLHKITFWWVSHSVFHKHPIFQPFSVVNSIMRLHIWLLDVGHPPFKGIVTLPYNESPHIASEQDGIILFNTTPNSKLTCFQTYMDPFQLNQPWSFVKVFPTLSKLLVFFTLRITLSYVSNDLILLL